MVGTFPGSWIPRLVLCQRLLSIDAESVFLVWDYMKHGVIDYRIISGGKKEGIFLETRGLNDQTWNRAETTDVKAGKFSCEL